MDAAAHAADLITHETIEYAPTANNPSGYCTWASFSPRPDPLGQLIVRVGDPYKLLAIHWELVNAHPGWQIQTSYDEALPLDGVAIDD